MRTELYDEAQLVPLLVVVASDGDPRAGDEDLELIIPEICSAIEAARHPAFIPWRSAGVVRRDRNEWRNRCWRRRRRQMRRAGDEYAEKTPSDTPEFETF